MIQIMDEKKRRAASCLLIIYISKFPIVVVDESSSESSSEVLNMNLFITWNARVVVPIAVEMNNNVFFQFMLIPHFLTANYTIFTYKLEDCLCKMNAK